MQRQHWGHCSLHAACRGTWHCFQSPMLFVLKSYYSQKNQSPLASMENTISRKIQEEGQLVQRKACQSCFLKYLVELGSAVSLEYFQQTICRQLQQSFKSLFQSLSSYPGPSSLALASEHPSISSLCDSIFQPGVLMNMSSVPCENSIILHVSLAERLAG